MQAEADNSHCGHNAEQRLKGNTFPPKLTTTRHKPIAPSQPTLGFQSGRHPRANTRWPGKSEESRQAARNQSEVRQAFRWQQLLEKKKYPQLLMEFAEKESAPLQAGKTGQTAPSNRSDRWTRVLIKIIAANAFRGPRKPWIF